MKNKNKEDINNMDVDTLISNLQTKDDQYKEITKSVQIVFLIYIFLIFIFFYVVLYIINPDSEFTINNRIAGACYMVAFTLFILYFRKYYKKLKTVNYSEPVKKVLEDAEKRYKFWQTDGTSVIFALILIDAATFFIFLNAFNDKFTFTQIFMGVQGIFLIVIGVSFTIGYVLWVRDSKPIWLSAKKLLKELEE